MAFMEYPLLSSALMLFLDSIVMFRVTLDEESQEKASAAGTPWPRAQLLGFQGPWAVRTGQGSWSCILEEEGAPLHITVSTFGPG